MRLLLLLVLALGLAAALPQRERGSRRFSLATPGLLSGTRGRSRGTPVEETGDAPEQEVQEPARASQPLRSRNRFPSRLRDRANPQDEPTQEPPIKKEPVVEENDPSSGRGGGLRLRRPVKKVVITTTPPTTTTTTTLPPPTEPDTIMDKPQKEDKPQDAQKPSKKETLLKKEEVKTEAEPMPEEKQEKQPEPEPEPVPAETPKGKLSKGLPRPKLRPIPIKLGGRGGGAKAPEQKQAEAEAIPEDQDPTPSQPSPVSSHRFGGRRNPPRIQGRGRGARGSQAEANPQENQTPNQPSGAEGQQPASPRVRGPSRSLSRLSPRRRTPEAAAETPAEAENVEEEPVSEAPSQRRFPKLKGRNADERDTKGKAKQNRRKISRLRPRRPSPSFNKKKASKDEDNQLIEKQTRIRPDLKPAIVPLLKGVKKTKSETGRTEKKIDQIQVETTTAAVETKPKAPVELPFPVPEGIKITEETPSTQSPPRETPTLVKTTTQATVLKPVKKPDAMPTSISPSKSRHISTRNRSRGHSGRNLPTRLIGTVEDTPPHEVRQILSGLGSRRRGLSKVEVPIEGNDATPAASSHQEQLPLADEVDYLYEYYDYLI